MIYSDWHFCHDIQMNPQETAKYLDTLFILRQNSICLQERLLTLDKLRQMDALWRAYAVPDLVDLLFSPEAKAAYEAEEDEEIAEKFQHSVKQTLLELLPDSRGNRGSIYSTVNTLEKLNDDEVLTKLRSVSDERLEKASDYSYLETQAYVPELIWLTLLNRLSLEQVEKVQEIILGNLKGLFLSACKARIGLLPQSLALGTAVNCGMDFNDLKSYFPEDWLSFPEYMDILARGFLSEGGQDARFEAIQAEITGLALFQGWNRQGMQAKTSVWVTDGVLNKPVLCAVLWQSVLWEFAWETDPERSLELANNTWGPPNFLPDWQTPVLPKNRKNLNWITQKVLETFPPVRYEKDDPEHTVRHVVCTPWQLCIKPEGKSEQPFQSTPALRKNVCALRAFAASAFLRRIFTEYPSACWDAERNRLRNHNILRLILNLGFVLESSGLKEERIPFRTSYTHGQTLRGLGCYAHLCITSLGTGNICRELPKLLTQDIQGIPQKNVRNNQLKEILGYQGLLVCARWAVKAQLLYTVKRTGTSGSPWEGRVRAQSPTCVSRICVGLFSKIEDEYHQELRENADALQLFCQSGFAFRESGMPPYWYDRCREGMFEGDTITTYDLLQAPIPSLKLWTEISPTLSALKKQVRFSDGMWQISVNAWEIILTLRLRAALEAAEELDFKMWGPWFDIWYETLSSDGNLHDNPVLFYALIQLLECEPHIPSDLDMDKNTLDMILSLIVQLIDVFTEGDKAYFQYQLGRSLANASPAFGIERLHRACADHLAALDRQSQSVSYADDLRYDFLGQLLSWPPEKAKCAVGSVYQYMANHYKHLCANNSRNDYHIQQTTYREWNPQMDRYLYMQQDGRFQVARQRVDLQGVSNEFLGRPDELSQRKLGIITSKLPRGRSYEYHIHLGYGETQVISDTNFKLGDMAIVDTSRATPRLFNPLWDRRDDNEVLLVKVESISVSGIRLKDAKTRMPLRDYLRSSVRDTLHAAREVIDARVAERLSPVLDLWTPDTSKYENGQYRELNPQKTCEVVYHKDLESYIPVERSFFRLLLDAFCNNPDGVVRLLFISNSNIYGVPSALFSTAPGFNYRLSECDWTEESFSRLSKELFKRSKNYGIAVTVRLTEERGFLRLALAADTPDVFDTYNSDWAGLFSATEVFCAEREGNAYWVTKPLLPLLEAEDGQKELLPGSGLPEVKVKVKLDGWRGMNDKENCELFKGCWSRLQQRRKEVKAKQYRDYSFGRDYAGNPGVIKKLLNLHAGDVLQLGSGSLNEESDSRYCMVRMKGTCIPLQCAKESIVQNDENADRSPNVMRFLQDRDCVVEDIFPPKFRAEFSAIETAELIPEDMLPESLRELSEEVGELWGIVVAMPGPSADYQNRKNLNYQVSIFHNNTVAAVNLAGSDFGRLPNRLGCKVILQRQENGWRATSFQQTIYVRALWTVEIHSFTNSIPQDEASLGLARVGRNFRTYYVTQDCNEPVLHAWPEELAPQEARELSGIHTGYVQLKDPRYSIRSVFRYARYSKDACLIGRDGSKRWGEVNVNDFSEDTRGKASARIYEVDGLRELYQAESGEADCSGKKIEQMPLYDLRIVFEPRKQDDPAAKKLRQENEERAAWYNDWYNHPERRHMLGKLSQAPGGRKVRSQVPLPAQEEACMFKLLDCQLPDKVQATHPVTWLDEIPFSKSDERQIWVWRKYLNGANARARIVEEDGHWAASCLTAEPTPLDEELPKQFGFEVDELIELNSLDLYFAGVAENESLRFEWGFGYTFLAPRDCIVDVDFRPNDAALFYGDRIRKFYVSYWAEEGKWVLRLPPDAIDYKGQTMRHLWADASLGIIQMMKVRIDRMKRRVDTLQVSYSEREISEEGNSWKFDWLYIGRLDEQSQARLLEEADEEEPAQSTVNRQIFALLARDNMGARERPPQFHYISLKEPSDVRLLARKIVCLVAGDIEEITRQSKAKQSNDFRLKFYLDTELPDSSDENDRVDERRISLVVNVNRRKFSLDESKLRVLYTHKRFKAFYGNKMLVRLEETDFLHFHGEQVEWSGFVRGIHVRDQSALQQWVNSKTDCLVTLGGITREWSIDPMVQVEVAPGITCQIERKNIENYSGRSGATALLEMEDDTLKAYVVLPGDEEYLPKTGRVVELLIMDGAANRYNPDMEEETNAGSQFTVAGLPQLSFINQLLLENLIYRPWPRLGLVGRDDEQLFSKEAEEKNSVAYIECAPSQEPRLRFLNAPEGGEEVIQKPWSQLSFMDAASSAIFQSLQEGTWHYHDKTYGVYDRERGCLHIHDLPDGQTVKKFLVFPNRNGSLRIPKHQFRYKGFPIRELAENGIPQGRHTYAVAGSDTLSIWLEVFPGRLLELPKRFLFVSGCMTNLKQFPNEVLAPGDTLTLEEGISHKGGLRTLRVAEIHYGLRANLELSTPSSQRRHQGPSGMQQALLPVREVLEDGVVLGGTQWNLTYPLSHLDARRYQVGDVATLDGFNNLTLGGRLQSNCIGMLYMDAESERLQIYGAPELAVKTSKYSTDWEGADWLQKLLSIPHCQRRLFEAMGEGEMLPVNCRVVSERREVWFSYAQTQQFPEGTVLYGICLGLLEDAKCLNVMKLREPVVLVRAGKNLLHMDCRQLLPGLKPEKYRSVIKTMRNRGFWLHKKGDSWYSGTEDAPPETSYGQENMQLLDKVPEARGFLCMSLQNMEFRWLDYDNTGLIGEPFGKGAPENIDKVWEALHISDSFTVRSGTASGSKAIVRKMRVLEDHTVSLINVNRANHDDEVLTVGTKCRVTPLVEMEPTPMFRYIAEVYPQGELLLLYTENDNEVKRGRPTAAEVTRRNKTTAQAVLEGTQRVRQTLSKEVHKAYADSHDAYGNYQNPDNIQELLQLTRWNVYTQCRERAGRDARDRKKPDVEYCKEQLDQYCAGAPLVYLYSYMTAWNSPIAYIWNNRRTPAAPMERAYEQIWWKYVYAYLKQWMEHDGKSLMLLFGEVDKPDPRPKNIPPVEAIAGITATLLLHQLYLKGRTDAGNGLSLDAGKLSVHALRMLGLAGEASVQQEVLLKYWFTQERNSGLWTRLNHITIGGERTGGVGPRRNLRDDDYNGTLSSIQYHHLVTQCEHILHLDMDMAGKSIDVRKRIAVAQSLLYSVRRLKNFDAYEQTLEALSKEDSPLITWSLAKLGRTLTPRRGTDIAREQLPDTTVNSLKKLWVDCLNKPQMPYLILNSAIPLESIAKIKDQFNQCVEEFNRETLIV